MTADVAFLKLEQMLSACTLKEGESYQEKRVEFKQYIEQAVRSARADFFVTGLNVEQAGSIVDLCRTAVELSFELECLSKELSGKSDNESNKHTVTTTKRLIREARRNLWDLDRISLDHDISKAVKQNKNAKYELKRTVLLLRASILKAEVALERDRLDGYEQFVDKCYKALDNAEKDISAIKVKGHLHTKGIRAGLASGYSEMEKKHLKMTRELSLLYAIVNRLSSPCLQDVVAICYSNPNLEENAKLVKSYLIKLQCVSDEFKDGDLISSFAAILNENFDLNNPRHAAIVNRVRKECNSRIVELEPQEEELSEELRIKRAVEGLNVSDKKMEARLRLFLSNLKHAKKKIRSGKIELKHYEKKLNLRLSLIEEFKIKTGKNEKDKRAELDKEFYDRLQTRESRLCSLARTNSDLDKTIIRAQKGFELVTKLGILGEYVARTDALQGDVETLTLL